MGEPSKESDLIRIIKELCTGIEGSLFRELRLAEEVIVLRAERDALKSPTMPRRLREYTCPATERMYRVVDGVVQCRDADDVWRRALGVHPSACAGVADLLANPWEKIETLEEVVLSWFGPSVTKEYRDRLCVRIRTWLATQQPTEPENSGKTVSMRDAIHAQWLSKITLTDHIDALVKAGAVLVKDVDGYQHYDVNRKHQFSRDGLSRTGSTVLILPTSTEPTP